MPPVRGGPRLGFGNIKNVWAQLASVYRDQKAGRLSPNEARARVYTLQVMLGALSIIQGTELERRLEALEAETGVRRSEHWPA